MGTVNIILVPVFAGVSIILLFLSGLAILFNRRRAVVWNLISWLLLLNIPFFGLYYPGSLILAWILGPLFLLVLLIPSFWKGYGFSVSALKRALICGVVVGASTFVLSLFFHLDSEIHLIKLFICSFAFGIGIAVVKIRTGFNFWSRYYVILMFLVIFILIGIVPLSEQTIFDLSYKMEVKRYEFAPFSLIGFMLYSSIFSSIFFILGTVSALAIRAILPILRDKRSFPPLTFGLKWALAYIVARLSSQAYQMFFCHIHLLHSHLLFDMIFYFVLGTIICYHTIHPFHQLQELKAIE